MNVYDILLLLIGALALLFGYEKLHPATKRRWKENIEMWWELERQDWTGTKKHWRAILGIGMGLIIFVINLSIINLLTDTWFWMITSSLLLTAPIYFILWFPFVTFNVPEDQGWIMSNPWISESAAVLKTFSGFRRLRAQTEFESGFHWRWPGETRGAAIDMQRTIPVTGKEGQSYTLADSSTVEIFYLITVVPLPGGLIQFHRTPEKTIITRVQADVEATLQGYFGDKKFATFGKEEQAALKRTLVEKYGNLSHITPEHRRLGVQTSVDIALIHPPKTVADAQNFFKEMQKIIKIAKDMVEESGGDLTFREAMRMTLIAQGKGGRYDYIELASAFMPPPQQPKSKKGGQNGPKRR